MVSDNVRISDKNSYLIGALALYDHLEHFELHLIFEEETRGREGKERRREEKERKEVLHPFSVAHICMLIQCTLHASIINFFLHLFMFIS